MKTKTAKFDIQEILPIALVLVVAGIGIAYGISVQSDVRTDFVDLSAGCGLNSTGGTGGTLLYTGCGLDYNATTDSMTGVSTLAEKMPLIATIIVAAIVIGILVRYLFVRFN